MNLQAELYRIAEEAHKGVDDEYIHELCDSLTSQYDGPLNSDDLYKMSERVYAQHFESR